MTGDCSWSCSNFSCHSEICSVTGSYQTVTSTFKLLWVGTSPVKSCSFSSSSFLSLSPADSFHIWGRTTGSAETAWNGAENGGRWSEFKRSCRGIGLKTSPVAVNLFHLLIDGSKIQIKWMSIPIHPFNLLGEAPKESNLIHQGYKLPCLPVWYSLWFHSCAYLF